MTAGQHPVAYPVQFGVDYPQAERNRLTVAFRIVLVIPALIVLAVLNSTRALLFVPPLLLILFRNKYPRWWFDWNLQLLRYENRVSSYLLLLRDEYPSKVRVGTVTAGHFLPVRASWFCHPRRADSDGRSGNGTRYAELMSSVGHRVAQRRS